MSTLMMTITALATSVAAVVAIFTFRNDREKKRLSLFSESIHEVMDGEKKFQSKEYILSGDYSEDIETVRKYLGVKKRR